MKSRIFGLFLSSFVVKPSRSFFTPAHFNIRPASLSSRSYPIAQQKLFSTLVPEPGPCPECSDENGYWDGSLNFVCVSCGHEWLVESTDSGNPTSTVDNDGDTAASVLDSVGNELISGDTGVLVKELGKGLKKGLKITRIRIGDYGDGHDVQANVPGLGTYNLKSQFLKKTSK
jgi:protein PhnA